MAAHGHPTVAAILVAAGDGRRLGAEVPKAFVTVAGRTLLEHAAERFTTHPLVRDVVVAAPAACVEQARALVAEAVVVAGGPSRQRSVDLALAAVADDVDVVLVHDVARAFVPQDMITRVIDGLRLHDACGAVPVVPVADTIRVGAESGELGELVDRSKLLAMQTPQGFPRDVLVRAHAEGADAEATDDAALVAALQVGRIMAVRGDEHAFKITVPFDLVIAEAVAK